MNHPLSQRGGPSTITFFFFFSPLNVSHGEAKPVGDGRASAITIMHHSMVHTTYLNRLHTTWYVVMQYKKLKPREAFNSLFFFFSSLDRDDKTTPRCIANRNPDRRVFDGEIVTTEYSRRRTELLTDLPAGKANRDQGKEKLVEGTIIIKKKKEINSECEKSQWK